MRKELKPKRYIGREITVVFNEPPVLDKKPGCPDFLNFGDEALRVVETLDEWCFRTATDLFNDRFSGSRWRDEHPEVVFNQRVNRLLLDRTQVSSPFQGLPGILAISSSCTRVAAI